MTRSLCLLLLLLAVACGAQRSATFVAPASAEADAVFACVQTELKSLRFEILSRDERDRRLVVTRPDPSARVSDATFRRGFDQLTVQVASDAPGETSLEVIAQSFFEFFTRRGPTFQERPSSESAREAARSLLESCAAPATAAP